MPVDAQKPALTMRLRLFPLDRTAPIPITIVRHLDLRADDWRWPFAEQRRDEIDAYFARLREAKPQLWNGRVLLAREPRFEKDTLSARYFETDFASFLAWRDWGFPDRAVYNGFGMGALRGADGGFVLGEMAAHTANAGRIYFPSGTPDPSDLRNGQVDLDASVAREVAEETGLAPIDYVAAAEWIGIMTGQSIALIRILHVEEPAEILAHRIDRHIAAQAEPELTRMHIVRGVDDLTPAMPDFVAAFIAEHFGVRA